MNKIKTRRGVFIDINKSDIIFEHHNKVYKFSSNKKRDMFIARCQQRIDFIKANFNKLVNSKCYGINIDLTEMTIAQAKTKLIDCVYDTVYDTMLYK